ncbi:hypothetical protein J3F83DRAFT_334364 [Trichoderma novae-zelandiae]
MRTTNMVIVWAMLRACCGTILPSHLNRTLLLSNATYARGIATFSTFSSPTSGQNPATTKRATPPNTRRERTIRIYWMHVTTLNCASAVIWSWDFSSVGAPTTNGLFLIRLIYFDYVDTPPLSGKIPYSLLIDWPYTGVLMLPLRGILVLGPRGENIALLTYTRQFVV